ncbi:hypothetical protein O3M35_004478 [Rhynocoris fuscipes]|uniref:TsaA-like domain-containing protein n=1 Tax=Rhynocoris fuscipes TaxID=488301 RepID=A0AAW1CG03_9HEMI
MRPELFKISELREELQNARVEINNLREQINEISQSNKRDFESFLSMMKSWKCEGCSLKKCEITSNDESCSSGQKININNSVELTPIGKLSTEFPCKKGVPRQPGIVPTSKGSLTISSKIFTNPHHSLEGLSSFSHMWIIFYFDRNESTHVHAKVAPPRLNGEKTGVFATRSPHRPCPIGLSLVQIDRIEGSTIYFSGVDMVDGTPVLDIKPYIPQYDDPTGSVGICDATLYPQCDPLTMCPVPLSNPSGREAPDGEESEKEPTPIQAPLKTLAQGVRVPGWVCPKENQLNVNLSAEAERSLSLLNKLDVWPIIEGVLKEDPRSVYLKQKYINQFYTFLISDLHVSCKFNDNDGSVSVYKVGDANRMCECDQQEWRCEKHNNIRYE